MNFLSPNYNYLVLDTVQAAGADWDLTNGVFSVGNPLEKICKYSEILKATITRATAATAQKTTLTFTNAANSTYQFIIQQFNPVDGRTYTRAFTHTTAASGSSATTIRDFFEAAIEAAVDADQLFMTVADNGVDAIDITATSAQPIFTVSILQTGGGFTQSTGTPGVAAVGTLAALALKGITVTNAAYTTVHIEYAPIGGQNVTEPIGVKNQLDIYINEGAANFSSLIGTTGKISYTLAGRSTSTGSTAANPEILALV